MGTMVLGLGRIKIYGYYGAESTWWEWESK